MDASANRGNIRVTVTASISECEQRDPTVVCSVRMPAPPETAERNIVPRNVYSPSCAKLAQGAVYRPQDVQGNMKIVDTAACDEGPYSQGLPSNLADFSSSASEGEAEGGPSTAYAKLLQNAGNYNAWAPLLRAVLPSKDRSPLLGQICFDVTGVYERGSWLLPEELLIQQRTTTPEEEEERQIFTNTPVSEEEQQAIDEVLLQLLERQKEDKTGGTRQSCSSLLRGIEPAWLEQLVLRYLYSCCFDKQKTFDLLQSTLTFRTQQLPVSCPYFCLSRPAPHPYSALTLEQMLLHVPFPSNLPYLRGLRPPWQLLY